MRRGLSVILLGAIVFADIFTNPYITQIRAEDIVYSESYGKQLENDRKGNYSKKIYDEMVSRYVYGEGDEGNEEGKYTGLAKAVSDTDSDIVMNLSSFTYATEATDSKQAKTAINKWAVEIKGTLGKAVDDAFSAFTKDYPEVFWIKNVSYTVSVSSKITGDSNGVDAIAIVTDLIISPEEFCEDAREYLAEFNEAVIGVKDNIVSMYGVDKETPQSDIAKYIHDYLAVRLDYNYEAQTNGATGNYAYAFTPVGAFLNVSECKGVVCEGYTKAYKILCDQFGIENAILVGNAVGIDGSLGAHMWNVLKMEDGKWYMVDVTWDDQQENIYYNYFLAGQLSEGFGLICREDHLADNTFLNESSKEFVLPEISLDGYLNQESTGNEISGVQTPISQGSTEKLPVYDADDSQNQKNYKWIVYGIKSKTYTGKKIKQNIWIECDGETLKEGKDYKISYKNNINVGTATLIITPKGQYSNTNNISFNFKITKASIKKVSSAKIKAQKYKKGKVVKPAVKLKYKGRKLVKGKDFTVTYKNNKKKGTAKIIIKGKGNFKGKKVIKFKIK